MKVKKLQLKLCFFLYLSISEPRVLLEQEMMLDGAVVSASFDHSMDMGIVGTTAGTLWYINWTDSSSIRLISGHKTKVLLNLRPKPKSILYSCMVKSKAASHYLFPHWVELSYCSDTVERPV